MEQKDNQYKELNDKAHHNLKKVFKSYTIAEKLKVLEIAEKIPIILLRKIWELTERI